MLKVILLLLRFNFVVVLDVFVLLVVFVVVRVNSVLLCVMVCFLD